ncbi:hypothetical protein [Streptosporangium sp. NPDC051022]|uniref:hypothetical protein n=1 Tax=Streptosporangium sp. NPDC051022 TaxID=3155752 RepID=UPI00343A6D88
MAGATHVKGVALDVRPREGARWLEEHGARYDLYRIYDNEWWHFEYRPDSGGRPPRRLPHPGVGYVTGNGDQMRPGGGDKQEDPAEDRIGDGRHRLRRGRVDHGPLGDPAVISQAGAVRGAAPSAAYAVGEGGAGDRRPCHGAVSRQ